MSIDRAAASLTYPKWIELTSCLKTFSGPANEGGTPISLLQTPMGFRTTARGWPVCGPTPGNDFGFFQPQRGCAGLTLRRPATTPLGLKSPFDYYRGIGPLLDLHRALFLNPLGVE